MTQIWESGPEDRGELLVLLALADFANDKGECWPSVATIAQKARMTPRSVQRICQELVAQGRLTICPNAARKGCNLYKITFNTPDAHVTPDTVSPLTPVSPPPDARVTPPLTPVSPEPSRTVIEPSVAARASTTVSESNDKHDARDKLLAAMGIGHDGIAGPSRFLGSPSDMAEAEKWAEMGISLQTQCQVIANVCRRERAKDPSWMPKRFSYFTGAMQDSLKAKASQPIQSDSKAERIKFYRQIAAS